MTTRTARVRKRPLPDPAVLEMEEADAARGDYTPEEAIRRGAFITNRIANLWRGKLVVTPLDLYDVLRALAAKKVPFVLTGANAVNTYSGRPRATGDVDILTKPGRNHSRAVNVIKERFPELEARVFRFGTAFYRAGEREPVIHVVLAFRKDNAESLVDAIWVDDKQNRVRYRIPALECCLANKYGAMLDPTRRVQKRLMDLADFGWMVVHSTDPGQAPVDMARLEELGEMVWPGGGGKELVRLVEMVKADEAIDLTTLGQQP